ncbi:hypothetical protein C8Q70DRAFT_1058342 [Cubamyces menziesii]|uniref:Ribonuclease H1 N-terminal domain-containing protein n=1 Tax=Trametes cubensis TaxID=1111947 RepID=A0AAD7TW70_9APHY|nr:hypothetical protein C8Q70DRAFT_1058342 [Cubamyces menziesii]KAJ8487310.1 hypothetical protein ONZ51_g4238 [Trametes cubensis]
MRERTTSNPVRPQNDTPDPLLDFSSLSIGPRPEEAQSHDVNHVATTRLLEPQSQHARAAVTTPVTVNVTVNLHMCPRPIDAAPAAINTPSTPIQPAGHVVLPPPQSPSAAASPRWRKTVSDYPDTWHPPRTRTSTQSTSGADPVREQQGMRDRQEGSSIIRGGGRVAAWDPNLEHIEPEDPAHRRKWYVVTAGRRVGIWKSWLDMEDYIDVKGRRYQSFDTRGDAEHHYNLARSEGRVRLLLG